MNVKNRDHECVIVSRNRTLELLDSKTALWGENCFVKLWKCLPKPDPKSCVSCLVKENEILPKKEYNSSVVDVVNLTGEV